MLLKLNSKEEVRSTCACDRIIARLGATPQREFVEACGIKFPNKDAARRAAGIADLRDRTCRACTSSVRSAVIR